MPKFLTQEWLDEARELASGQPERSGVSGTLQSVVSGGPDGEIRYYSVVRDGKIAESSLGNRDDADLVFTLTYDDAVLIQQGELDPNAAYMQGRLKPAGDMAKLLQLLPLTKSPDYQELQERLRKRTEF